MIYDAVKSTADTLIARYLRLQLPERIAAVSDALRAVDIRDEAALEALHAQLTEELHQAPPVTVEPPLEEAVMHLLREEYRSDRPTLTYVVGQPGSGKSALIHELAPGLNIDSDLLRLLFPATESSRTGEPIPQDGNEVAVLGKQLLRRGLEESQSIYMEHLLRNSTSVRVTIAEAIRRGYRIQAEVMAVPRKVSLLGIAARYLDDPTWISLTAHDSAYAAVASNLRLYPRLFNSIRVRDSQLRVRYEGDDVREATAMVKRVRQEPMDEYFTGMLTRFTPQLEALSAADPQTAEVIGALFVATQ
ncbi:MAG: zeta toxin family protein [Corynebacterium sp.]|nr:zeta toxin family protein [Corynebacterium sp.]